VIFVNKMTRELKPKNTALIVTKTSVDDAQDLTKDSSVLCHMW